MEHCKYWVDESRIVMLRNMIRSKTVLYGTVLVLRTVCYLLVKSPVGLTLFRVSAYIL